MDTQTLDALTGAIDALDAAVEALTRKAMSQHENLVQTADLLELASEKLVEHRKRIDGLEYRIQELEKGAL